MSYGNHINYNTGQPCDCSLAINGGHYYPNFEVSWWSNGFGPQGGERKPSCPGGFTVVWPTDKEEE